jgi:hypothetical protein
VAFAVEGSGGLSGLARRRRRPSAAGLVDGAFNPTTARLRVQIAA